MNGSMVYKWQFKKYGPGLNGLNSFPTQIMYDSNYEFSFIVLEIWIFHANSSEKESAISKKNSIRLFKITREILKRLITINKLKLGKVIFMSFIYTFRIFQYSKYVKYSK